MNISGEMIQIYLAVAAIGVGSYMLYIVAKWILEDDEEDE